MSISVLTAIWARPPCSGGDLLCLLAIADNADDEGYAWPSMDTIARKANLSERGARKCVRNLQDMGLIEVESGGGRRKTNAYQITTCGVGHDESHKNPEQNSRNPSSGYTEETRNRAARNPEQSDTKPGTPVPPNRKEPSKNCARAENPMKDLSAPLRGTVTLIKSGHPYLCVGITATKARALVNEGFVTEQECRKVGVL